MVKVQKFLRMAKNILAIGFTVSEKGKVFINGPVDLSMLVSLKIGILMDMVHLQIQTEQNMSGNGRTGKNMVEESRLKKTKISMKVNGRMTYLMV